VTPKTAAIERVVAVLPDYVNDVDVSSDGRHVAAGSVSGHLAIVDLHGDARTIDAHEGDVVRARWSPSGAFVATCGIDGALRIWQPSGALIAESRHAGWATDLAWRPSSDEVAATIGRRVVRLLADGTESVRHPDLKATAECLAWSDDGRRLFVGHYGGVTMFQGTPQPVKSFPWKGAPLVVAASPDGKWVVSGNHDSSLHVWKIANGDDLQMTGFATKVQLIAWSRDSMRLANTSMEEVCEWNFAGRGPKGTTPVSMLGHTSRLVGLRYSPTHPDILGSAASDGSLCLWRPTRSRESLVHSHQSDFSLRTMTWSPTELRMLCGTAGGEVVSFEFDASSVGAP